MIIIFLPAAGYREGKELNMVGSYGYYWSNSYGFIFGTSSLFFNARKVEYKTFNRYRGHPVRPICP